MALAFRLFNEDGLRFRSISIITTVGLVGLAIGPTVGGLILAIALWQVLLLVNVPIAILAFIGVRTGISADDPAELHREPVDLLGALLGTAAIVLALLSPTMFLDFGAGSWVPWASSAGAILALGAFIARERTARYPLIELGLIRRPLVSSGLAFQAAVCIATAGMGYMVTLQLQLDYGHVRIISLVGAAREVRVAGRGDLQDGCVRAVVLSRLQSVLTLSQR